jgi:hypothetical protein
VAESETSQVYVAASPAAAVAVTLIDAVVLPEITVPFFFQTYERVPTPPVATTAKSSDAPVATVLVVGKSVVNTSAGGGVTTLGIRR